MGPELALAVATCAIESTEIIATIFKKIREVRHFKRKCQGLGDEARVLQGLLGKHPSAITNFQSLQDFENCLTHIAEFVDKCKSYNVLRSSWDVLKRRSYPALIKEITAIKELFLFESVLVIGANVAHLVEKTESGEALVQTSQALATLKQNIQSVEDTPVSVDFVVDSDKVEWDTPQKAIGWYQTSSGARRTCRVISSVLSAKRNLAIYRDIQYGAYVQQYYGVAEIKGQLQRYAILEDMREGRSLLVACQNSQLPKELEVRLKMAYDVAKSLAWLHKADLLLKGMTDRTIILKADASESIVPHLTEIESIRHVLELTSRTVHDIRFEAPEYAKLRQHSRQTDIWSLGAVIWQIMTGKLPFNTSADVTHPSLDTEHIRSRLAAGEFPGQVEDILEAPEVAAIVKDCWHRDPYIRPTAEDVAERLLGALTRLWSPPPGEWTGIERKTSQDSMTSPSSVKLEAFEVIKSARALNNKAVVYEKPKSRLSATGFAALMDEESTLSASDAFLIGALLLWDGIETDADNPDIQETEDRILTAIAYLESAAQRGYKDAYLELYKAHALLARKYLAMVPARVKVP